MSNEFRTKTASNSPQFYLSIVEKMIARFEPAIAFHPHSDLTPATFALKHQQQLLPR